MERRSIGTRFLLAAGLVTTGCLGPAEPTNEVSAAGENVGGKTVTLVATQTRGWPNQTESFDGGVVVLEQDQTAYKAAGELFVFRKVYYDIQIEVDQSWLQWASTDIAMTVLHRDRAAGPSASWISLRCGDEYASQLAVNGYRFFDDGTTIDVAGRKILTREGLKSFDECGVTEADPELAVFALPWQNVGDMRDPYGYSVWARCDGRDCGNDQRYEPAVFADNPVASPTAPQAPSGTPRNILAGQAAVQETLTTYYGALGSGDLQTVERLWMGLSEAGRQRLREIARNGAGFQWTLELSNERRGASLYDAIVDVVIKAERGTEAFAWAGNIRLVWSASPADPMRWGWFITGMRLGVR